MDFAINLNPGGVGFNDPDLSAFHERGGKIIAYHGRIDQTITSRLAMDYFARIQAALDITVEEMQDFYQLFLIPGHSHCTGGPGAWNVGQTYPMDPGRLDAENNALLSLVEWVENEKVPGSLVGSKHADDDVEKKITAQRSEYISCTRFWALTDYYRTLRVPSQEHMGWRRRPKPSHQLDLRDAPLKDSHLFLISV